MAFGHQNTSTPTGDISISSQRPMYEASLGRTKKSDGEISVFSAEKYFNGALDDTTARKGKKEPHQKDELKGETHEMIPRTRTPSISTEASWNSRSGLLLPVKPRQQGKGIGKKIIAALGCNCCQNKSIDVDENTRESQIYIKGDEEAPRSGIDVYSTSVMNKEDIALNLEKRLAMLTWDANPRTENTTLVRRVVGSEASDDIDSDSSSELFEIKSLSSKGHGLFRHQESHNTSECVSPSYEPSEASLDWSVANFSVASYKTTMKKRRPSMLVGCRSQGAVKVVGGAQKPRVKEPDCSGYPRLKSDRPKSRFQEDTEVKGIDPAQVRHLLAQM